jgi:hypothetical protein
VKPGDLAFVYYSGHGVEVHGVNYLLPVDLPSDATEGYVEDEAVSAQRLLRELDEHGAAVKVLILDSCRDNPLRAAKSTAGGLAPMEGRGSLIIFATEAGKTASDTPGSSNSVFTRNLLKSLRQPGVPLFDVMRVVAKNVARETNDKQVPAIYGMMLEDVILVPSAVSHTPQQSQSSSPVASAPDQDAWLAVKDSGEPWLIEQFIKEYPQSAYAEVARLKLASIASSKSSKPQASVPQGPPNVMHWCSGGCFVLIGENGHYVNPSNTPYVGNIYTVESFTPESVIMHRTDYGQIPGNAVLTGRISADGNSIVNGTIKWTYHPCCGVATLPFWAAWGAAENSLPSSGPPPPSLLGR